MPGSANDETKPETLPTPELETTPEPEPVKPEPEETPSPEASIDDRVEALVAEHNGDMDAALNAATADFIRMSNELADVERGIVRNPDGTTSLFGEAARELEALQALGTPEEIRQRLAEGEKASKEVAEHQRQARFKEAAKLLGYTPIVFSHLASGDGLDVVVRDEKDPKTLGPIKAVYLVNEDGKRLPVAEYAEKNWSVYLSSLSPQVQPVIPPRGSPSSANGMPRPHVGQRNGYGGSGFVR